MRKLSPIQSVDDYINSCPAEKRETLKVIRKTILEAAPEATEKIGYQMPSFSYKGILVYFAAQANHIGFYPGPGAIEAFRKELSDYPKSKGTIRFSYEKPLPLPLIAEIVKFCAVRNREKEESKAKKK